MGFKIINVVDAMTLLTSLVVSLTVEFMKHEFALCDLSATI